MNSRIFILLFGVVLTVFALIEWRPWLSWGANLAMQTESSVEQLSKKDQIITSANTDAAIYKSEPTSIKQALPFVPGNERTDISKQAIRAQLSPVQYTTIVAEINGKISKLPLREGESFSDRQLLVAFDCALHEAQLQKFQAQLSIAARKLDTNRKLLERGAVSKVETDNSASEYERANAEVKELSILVSKCKIQAPYIGKIVEQRVRAQQFVQTGQPLMEILDNSAMELDFIAPSNWMSWIKIGYIFQISIDETGKNYPARVTRIGAKIDSVSQTVKIAATIDGDFSELSPGMSGTIKIEVPAKNQ